MQGGHNRYTGSIPSICGLFFGSLGALGRIKGFVRQRQQKVEMLRTGSKMQMDQVFHSGPEIMGGTPVFTGTRVPVQNLVDYLEGGESIEDFLDMP